MKGNKSIILAIAMFVLFILSCPTSAAYKNEPDGFRGITWGTELETVKDNMVFKRTDSSYGGIHFYTKKDDDMTIGAAKLDMIQYGFWQGKFYVVYIYVDGYSNWSGVQEALTAKFGGGYKHNRYLEEYYWFGDKTTISSEYREIRKNGLIRFSSEEMHKKMEEWENQKKHNNSINNKKIKI